ncbi:MAG: adenylyl cyclase [Pseudomonadota bacterium]
MSFLSELKRRNVYRVAGVYAVVGWLLVQIAATVEDAIALPSWFDAVVLSFLVIGFPIVLVFAWAFELTPDGIKRTSAVSENESITSQTGSKLDALLVVALFVFAGAILAPRFLPSSRSDGTDETRSTKIEPPTAQSRQAIPAPPADTRASIAVLPFADLSPEGNQEYFADGVSEELLNVLAKVEGMRVAGRTSSFAFKGRNEDLREIGQVLGVAQILEGSVRSQGDRVRVTAQLIQASDGFHLWSETYDGNLSDIFAVQDDIAQKILLAMKEVLGVSQAPKVASATRTDIDAYNLFLEARDLITSRTRENLERAMDLLNKAIVIDDAYAPAFAARAQAFILLSDRPTSYGSLPAKEAHEQAQRDIDTALVLDPKLAQGFAVRGLLESDVGRRTAAAGSFREALALNPSSLDARLWLANSLYESGLVFDSITELQKLLDIDPLFGPAANNLMIALDDVGQYEESTRFAQQMVDRVRDPQKSIRFRTSVARHTDGPASAIQIALALGVDQLSTGASGELVTDFAALGIDTVSEGSVPPIPLFQPSITAALGRSEAAVEEAFQRIDKNSLFAAAHAIYLEVLATAGDDDKVIKHYNDEYDGDLNSLTEKLTAYALDGVPPYMELALAAKTTGDQSLFDEAMSAWRRTIDRFRAGGSASGLRDVDDARYWAMQGDATKAVSFLTTAYEKLGYIPIWNFRERAFTAIKDSEAFVKIHHKNLVRINEERAKLNREPLDQSFYE